MFSNICFIERIHKLTPASEAKRLKLDNEEDDDDYDDVMDKDNRQGFIEENLEVGAVAPTLIGDKCAQLVASKSLDERQKEFKQMLLERGVSYISLCNQSTTLRDSFLYRYLRFQHGKKNSQNLCLINDVNC